MNPANVVSLISLAGFMVCLVLSACPGPQPLPTPIGPESDAAVVDAPLPVPLFDHQVFDCHQDIVKVEYQSAKPDIKRCLSLPGILGCLALQAGQYNVATVACLARPRGRRQRRGAGGQHRSRRRRGGRGRAIFRRFANGGLQVTTSTFWALGVSEDDAICTAQDGRRFPVKQDAVDAAQIVGDVAGDPVKLYVVTLIAAEDIYP
jgi:hypothetical protein